MSFCGNPTMPRIEPVDVGQATGRARQLLDGIQTEWGMVPNIVRTLAHALSVLEGYLGFERSLGRGGLSAGLREQIAVAVAEENQCRYCLAAHSAMGRAVGLSDAALADARRGPSPDRKVEAALQFARKIVAKRGWVDDDIRQLREAGYTDQETVEIIANVALNIFTNYFNHAVDTEVDFPEVRELAGSCPAKQGRGL
jgi:uncharacterized peroxidase-related enzyme